ncbi:extracellular matrix protein 2 isoform X2 [Polypterus senegalus]|nr:extracellular matrix protein 2 isoform X2 [Polypterus senegalus]
MKMFLILLFIALWGNSLANVRVQDRRVQRNTRIDPKPANSPASLSSNLFPGGHCLVNGMVMFESAVWSPKPCSVCSCKRGKVNCEDMLCSSSTCVGPACVPTDHNPAASLVPGKKLGRKIAQASKTKTPADRMKQKSEKIQAAASPRQDVQQNGKPRKQEVVSQRKEKAPLMSERQDERKMKKQDVKSGKQEVGGSTMKQERKKGNMKKEEKAPKTFEEKEKVKFLTKGTQQTSPKWLDGPKLNAPSHPRFKDLNDFDDADSNENNHEDIYDDLGDFFFGRTLPDQPRPSHTRHAIMESLPVGCILSESTIGCGGTKMTHVPILNDPGIKTLYLAENEISKIPAGAFSGLTGLEWLDLSKNRLNDSSFSSELFQNLTKLKRLNLDGNFLTKIPPLPPSLEELKMNDNKLKGLDQQSFKGLLKLLTLELEGNGLHDGNVVPLAFKPLSRLIYLRLDENRFRALPSGLPSSLQELHMDENLIEDIQEGILNKTLNLVVLVLSNNRIQENRIAPRAWFHLSKLEAIDLSYNRLVHVPSFLPVSLRQLTLHHNQIERIPGYVFAHMKPGLEFLHLSHNKLRDDGIHGVSFMGLYHSLTELLVDNNQLRTIPRGILNLKSLQVLRLNDNHIRYVPLNSVCDTRVTEDSSLISLHLENNLIDRRQIPPTAFSCIKTYHSVVLRPQKFEE